MLQHKAEKPQIQLMVRILKHLCLGPVNLDSEARLTKFKPQDLIAIVDTREQLPADLTPLTTIRRTLKTGDYSVHNLEEKIAIERKSLPDFIACCGKERERFEKEIERLRAFDHRAIVVEGDWGTIDLKQYRGAMHPNAILGSALGWALCNVSIIMAGDKIRASKMIARMLWIAANRCYREKV